MKKVLSIVLTLVLVPIFLSADVVVRTVDGARTITTAENRGAEASYHPGRRQQVLFVEDAGGLGAPSPDQWWTAVMDSVLGVGNYGWFGPTGSGTENGPDLATMQGYELVIWNTYDWWAPGSPALTATDQTNVASYLSGGGKVWLIGQDVLWSGVPMVFMTANFDLASAVQDYSPSSGADPRPMTGESELAGYAFSYLVDWGSDVFPDALTPTANAHHIIFDTPSPSNHTSIMRDDYTSSFWTVDGRNPSPWQDWQDIVYDMMVLFGIISPVVNDVGTNSIDIPDQLPWNTIVAPQATVKNFGTQAETFDVTCEIEPGGYSSTETVTDLAADDSLQVTFTPDFTFATDTYTVTVYTQLGGDMDPVNDTLVLVVETYDPGIAEGGYVPEEFTFSATTISRGTFSIRFGLPAATTVELTVFDALGRLREILISERLSVGTHSIDAKLDLPAGVYFYNLKTGSDEGVNGKFVLVD